MLAPTLRRDLNSVGPSPYQQSTRVLDSCPLRIINDRDNQPYQDQLPDPVRGLRMNLAPLPLDLSFQVTSEARASPASGIAFAMPIHGSHAHNSNTYIPLEVFSLS